MLTQQGILAVLHDDSIMAHMNDKQRQQRLNELRQAIDAADDELLALIHRRADLARQVGEVKESRPDTPFYVPSREASIIRRVLARHQAYAEASHSRRIPDAAIHGIYREVIGACLALEHPMTIAFLGPEGTFSHAAARRQFGATASYLPCDHLGMVFDEVESGRANYGIVPVENALEGAVNPTLDLFAETERDIQACAEVQLAIHLQLFSYATRMEDIQWVISHPQPLGQCRRWLQDHLPHAKLRHAASTVQAASMIEEVRNGQDHGFDWQRAAAIGPEAITQYCELPCISRNIEDAHDNTTRFLVIGQHDAQPSGEDKTLLVASLQDRPGALNHLIEPFARRNISLCRIESRPSRIRHWQYFFFIEVLAHRDEPDMKQALEEVAAQSSRLLIRGSYPVARPL